MHRYLNSYAITLLLVLIVLTGHSTELQAQSEESVKAMIEETKANAARLEALLEEREEMKAEISDPNFGKRKVLEMAPIVDSLTNPTSGESKPALQKNIDVVWTVTAAVLVMFMQVGFCMLEIGLSRSRNAINVAMKNVLDFSASIISFLLFGFTIMFGASTTGWFGTDNFAVWKFAGDSDIWAFFFFQAVFVATACTIASGAMAERTKFVGYMCYTIILSGLIYPIFGHLAWGSFAGGLEEGFGGSLGLLEELGFLDFAGSTVVHGIGGASALAGVLVVGPRIGRFDEEGNPRLLPGHNLPLVAFGTLILWMGWFGFNAGSTVEGSAGIGRICVNTAVAGAAGSLAAMFFFWVTRGVPNVLMALNGILGGLVSITACCDVVTPFGAIFIGLIGGIIATFGSIVLEKMKVDDVVGAIPVHLFAGIWGTLCVAIFNENGFSIDLLGIQALGTIGITGGTFVIAFVLFKVIDTFIGLRVDDEEQEDGLDFTEHSANAYPDFQTTDV